MSFISEIPRHMLRSDMQSVPLEDTEDRNVSEVNGKRYAREESLIRRKPIGSGPKVQVYSRISANSDEHKTTSKGTVWIPRWSRVGPLLGLAALILTILSIPAAFTILYTSNGKPVSSWKYSPNVYLAVMTALTSKATSLAGLQGAVIAWWLRALRGSTFEQLHRDWQMVQNIWDALIAGRRMNMIAVACICAAVAAIDAPLLQRASTVVSRSPNTTVSLNVNLVSQMPGYYSGQLAYTSDTTDGQWIGTTDPNADFYPIVSDYLNAKPMGGIVKGCPGGCSLKVRPPMIAPWNCTETNRHINYTDIIPGNLTFSEQINSDYAQENRTAFYIGANLGITWSQDVAWGPREYMMMTRGLADTEASDTCAGKYNTKRCLFASAIGEYDLIVRDNQTSFVTGQAKPKFVQWANNTALTNETNLKYHLSTVDDLEVDANYNSTFSGIVFALSNEWLTSQVWFVPIAWPYHPDVVGMSSLSLRYIKDYIAFNRGNACLPHFIDPWDDMVAGLNELAFRIGVHVSRSDFRAELTSNQYLALDEGIADAISYKADALFTSFTNVYVVDYWFFFGAALIQVICVSVIMYTFYGWWRLGRAVSFSPLELAKAFESPWLAGVNSNASGDRMGNELGDRKLQYGVVGFESDRLAFSDAGMVQKPWRGANCQL